MLDEHLLVNSEEDFFFRDTKSNLSEVSSGSQVDIERTTLGVHACGEHNVLQDVLLLKMVSIEDDLVVDDLPDETQRRLSSVAINFWHVQIVHEEDQMTTCGGSEDFTGALVNVTL